MSLFNRIKEIKAQIVDAERMLNLVGNHPIMSLGIQDKLEQLKQELESLPKDVVEAKVRLLFSGSAVKGSQGIKSRFIGKTVVPFQSLVKTQTALIRFGLSHGKNQKKKKPNTDLYLTALPVGSFGVELSQLETNDLFDEHEVGKAIRQTIQLISSAAKSDEQFELATANTPKSTLGNLKTFFEAVYKENSIIKMETGDFGVQISEEEVRAAFERVDAAESEEDEIFVLGTLRGILLDSGKFEMVDIDGNPISGNVGKELEEEEIIAYDKEFLNQLCRIHLKTLKIIYKTGNEKTSYQLIGIEQQA